MRFLRALTTAAVTLSVAVLPLAVTDAADAAVRKKKSTETPPAHMRVVSFNTANGLSEARALRDVERLVEAGIGVIALQEMWRLDRREALRERFVDCDTCSYDGHIPPRGFEGATPILWRTEKFALVESGDEQVTDDWYVGASGAGPSTLQERFVTWVKLQERRTGKMLVVLNTHFAASVQGPKGGPNRKHARRLAHYRHQMRGLQNLVRTFEATDVPVFVTGDFNVNYRRDRIVRTPYFPYAALGSVGVRASYYSVGEPKHGTHVLRNGNNTRLIDYVAHTVSDKVTALHNAVLLGYSSDHRPVVAKFALH